MYYTNPKNAFEISVNNHFEKAHCLKTNVSITVTTSAYIYDQLTEAQQKELYQPFSIIVINAVE